jgi:hypothetical protein
LKKLFIVFLLFSMAFAGSEQRILGTLYVRNGANIGLVTGDSVKIGTSGSILQRFYMVDGAQDTLYVQVAGKTWKFIPATNQ